MFAIWQPMLPTDRSAPGTPVLERLSDERVRQYWDPTHLVATRMKNDARAPQPVQRCCVRSGILWDLVAVYPPGATWSDRMPPAAIFDGPVVDLASELDAALGSFGGRRVARREAWRSAGRRVAGLAAAR